MHNRIQKMAKYRLTHWRSVTQFFSYHSTVGGYRNFRWHL